MLFHAIFLSKNVSARKKEVVSTATNNVSCLGIGHKIIVSHGHHACISLICAAHVAKKNKSWTQWRFPKIGLPLNPPFYGMK